LACPLLECDFSICQKPATLWCSLFVESVSETCSRRTVNLIWGSEPRINQSSDHSVKEQHQPGAHKAPLPPQSPRVRLRSFSIACAVSKTVLSNPPGVRPIVMYERSPPSSPSSAIESGGTASFHSLSGSTRFRSGYESSHSDDRSRRLPDVRAAPPQKHQSKPKWISQIKDWLSVSEPSSQAFKQQKLKNAASKDSQAAARSRVSLGQIPPGATTSVAGPTPETALKRQLREKKARGPMSARTTTSISSRESYGYAGSAKEGNPATPAGW